MSTCYGAPPPHNDCPHGQSCDWQTPVPAPEPPHWWPFPPKEQM